jgi:ABC-type phosphate transport system substrate-binding protein
MTRRLAAIVTVAMLLMIAAAADGGDRLRIAVIVHPDRREHLDPEEVASIFLRKRRFWDDGAPIIPLNREAGSGLREHFSRLVLGVGSAELSAYWNQQYFHGTLPPATLSSSEAMKRFVAQERNAIGYTGAEAVDSSVRAALILE